MLSAIPQVSKVAYQPQFLRQLVPELWTGDVERPVTKLCAGSWHDMFV